MDRVPESSAWAELLRWIAYERDAAWTAKLAILRARRREDIAHFGACLREHDRHADELSQLVRVTDPAVEAPTEPCFVTAGSGTGVAKPPPDDEPNARASSGRGEQRARRKACAAPQETVTPCALRLS
jgi:hypothetical protein